MRYVLLSFITLFFLGCSHKTYDIPLTKSVDISNYKGFWFEVARYENSFEKGCVGASAEYKLENDKIAVTNRCYNSKSEEIAKANGNAYSTNKENTKLKVSFFWPFYGDYWIIKRANDYRYSIVSEPRKKYLWILSRSQKLLDEDKKDILSFLKNNGFDTTKLYWTSWSKDEKNIKYH